MGVTPAVGVSPMSSTLRSMVSHSIGGIIRAHHQEYPQRREHAKDIRPWMIPPGEQRLSVVRRRRTFRAVAIIINMVFFRDIIVQTRRRHRFLHVWFHFSTIGGSQSHLEISTRELSIRKEGESKNLYRPYTVPQNLYPLLSWRAHKRCLPGQRLVGDRGNRRLLADLPNAGWGHGGRC